MSIISSTFALGHQQIDGRRYVVETHTDSAGGVHLVEYLADGGTDYSAIATARAALLAQMLADAEAMAIIQR